MITQLAFLTCNQPNIDFNINVKTKNWFTIILQLHLTVILFKLTLYISLIATVMRNIRSFHNTIKSLYKFPLLYGFSSKQPVKVPSIHQVKDHWQQFSHQYNTFDYGPLTFFYTLSYMMELHKANRILEVACGTGKLLPMIIQMKKKQTEYVATDLAPNMVKLADENLKRYFENFQSNLSYEQWKEKHRLIIKQLDGEKLQKSDFDRILCNCCLMLTEDAQKMLQSFNRASVKGAILGLSIWGQRDKNNLMNALKESVAQTGNKPINERNGFHLNGKIQKMLEENGWQIILNWHQNTLFPILQLRPEEQAGLLYHHIERLPDSYRQQVRSKFLQKLREIMDKKIGLHFQCQLVVARKKNDLF